MRRAAAAAAGHRRDQAHVRRGAGARARPRAAAARRARGDRPRGRQRGSASEPPRCSPRHARSTRRPDMPSSPTSTRTAGPTTGWRSASDALASSSSCPSSSAPWTATSSSATRRSATRRPGGAARDGPRHADGRLARGLLRGVRRARLPRDPVRQPRHRPLDARCRAASPTLRQLLLRDKRAAAYTLDDMADDGFGLLDHLGSSARTSSASRWAA